MAVLRSTKLNYKCHVLSVFMATTGHKALFLAVYSNAPSFAKLRAGAEDIQKVYLEDTVHYHRDSTVV